MCHKCGRATSDLGGWLPVMGPHVSEPKKSHDDATPKVVGDISIGYCTLPLLAGVRTLTVSMASARGSTSSQADAVVALGGQLVDLAVAPPCLHVLVPA
jgi:hypothetical protein